MYRDKTFWRTIPWQSIALFLLGVFFIFTIIAFASDIFEMGRMPLARFVWSVLLSGTVAVCYATAGFTMGKGMWKVFAPLMILHVAVMSWLSQLYPHQPMPTQMGIAEITRLQSRLTFDGVACVIVMALGYACFVYVSIAESRRYFRVHSEMGLAAEIHRALVPMISTKIGGFEFYGRSVPSGEVGGDLVDVFENSRGWVAYVADVSGHGVAPGVLMAMVKSAARMQLSSSEKSVAFLERLNSVLYPIKKQEMFATVAYLEIGRAHV